MKIRLLLSFGLLLTMSFGLISQAQTEWNRRDESGLKLGPWKGYYPGGEIRYMGQFKNDLPVDTFQYYFTDGKLKSILIHDPANSNKVFATHFYQTGDTLAKGHYLNQKKEGVWKSYGENSVLVREGLYINEKRNGKWTTYYANGKVSEEIHYKDDIENGSLKTYFSNGQINMDAFYLDGVLHGQVTFYNEEGKKEQEGDYKEGLRDGKWLVYDKNELVIKLFEYDNGKLLNPEDKDKIDYNKEEFKSQKKDYLEFDDIRGKIQYE